MQPKRAKPWASTGDTLLAGNVSRRDKVRQGGKERIPKEISFLPLGGKGARGPQSARAPPRLPRPRLGWLSSALTAPSPVAPPSECIWRPSSSSSSSFAAGTGTPGWGPPGLALRPAPARPPPSTFQPRHAPSPRLRTAASSASPPPRSSALPTSSRGRK